MSIESVVIESIHGAKGQQRMIFYRAQDHLGVWHNYGPVMTIDDNWDEEAFRATVAAKMAVMLADREFSKIIEKEA